jgi:ATP-binding cassette subfamily F protein uup
MERIEQAEAVVSGLEGELADPDLYATRGSEVPGLHAKLAQARSEADVLTSRWEQLEMKKEEGERKS